MWSSNRRISEITDESGTFKRIVISKIELEPLEKARISVRSFAGCSSTTEERWIKVALAKLRLTKISRTGYKRNSNASIIFFRMERDPFKPDSVTKLRSSAEVWYCGNLPNLVRQKVIGVNQDPVSSIDAHQSRVQDKNMG